MGVNKSTYLNSTYRIDLLGESNSRSSRLSGFQVEFEYHNTQFKPSATLIELYYLINRIKLKSISSSSIIILTDSSFIE